MTLSLKCKLKWFPNFRKTLSRSTLHREITLYPPPGDTPNSSDDLSPWNLHQDPIYVFYLSESGVMYVYFSWEHFKLCFVSVVFFIWYCVYDTFRKVIPTKYYIKCLFSLSLSLSCKSCFKMWCSVFKCLRNKLNYK
jgi:hypothetical protein